MHTPRYRPAGPRSSFDPSSMLPLSIGEGSRRYSGSGSPKLSHSEELGAHLFVGLEIRFKIVDRSRHLPVGETEGSLLAISSHEPLGRTSAQYAMTARHCASIEGREKAGPHTCSCSTIVACVWRKQGGRD